MSNAIKVDSAGVWPLIKELEGVDSFFAYLYNPVGVYNVANFTVAADFGLNPNELCDYCYYNSLVVNGASTRIYTHAYKYIVKYKNSNKLLLLGKARRRDGSGFFNYSIGESLEQENNFDIHLPELWSCTFNTNSTGRQFTIDIIDKYYQSDVWTTGEPNSEKTIGEEIVMTFNPNLEGATELGLTDTAGWEVMTSIEGPVMYYIKYNDSYEINRKLVFTEEGPLFNVYREVCNQFIRDADPTFNLSEGYEILFKKGNDLEDGVSFDSHKYNAINNLDYPDTIADGESGAEFVHYGDPIWFNEEKYELAIFPDQAKFDAQETIEGTTLFNQVPDRQSALDIEQDADIPTSILGTYRFYNRVNRYNQYMNINWSHKVTGLDIDCEYLRKLLTSGESKNYAWDWAVNNGFKDYLTLNNFVFNMLQREGLDNKSYDIITEVRNRFFAKGLNFRTWSRRSRGFRGPVIKNIYAVDSVFDLYTSIRVGVSDGCGVFQRKLHYLPEVGRTVIEWSLNHNNPYEGKAVFDPIMRRLYSLTDTFSYQGKDYPVLEYPPFQDFGMVPVSWRNDV